MPLEAALAKATDAHRNVVRAVSASPPATASRHLRTNVRISARWEWFATLRFCDCLLRLRADG